MARKVNAATTRKTKSPTGALVKNKATSPMVKITDMRAASGERMAIARARMAEKLKHMSASVRLSIARIRHPVHPVHKAAAKEAARESKSAATERRRQAVAAAKNTAARKRALVRERRARQMTNSVL